MLFSERYANLIDTEHGQFVDNICGDIDDATKSELSGIMREFAEPQRIYPDRYSSYDVCTTALESAINSFNEIKGVPYIKLTHNVFEGPMYDHLAATFTPFLFDVIELQYNELSNSEKVDFQAEINIAFMKHSVPWILCDGRLIKIDAAQFELDLEQKALETMRELKDSDPKFQAAYDELLQACDFWGQNSLAAAISNAGKSYESVLKVICGLQRGNADKLTKTYLETRSEALPATMTLEGFREKVLIALPFICNNSSADHGAGATPTTISKPLAKLAINLAAALNTYLIEEYKIELTANAVEPASSSQDDKDELPF